MLWVLHGQQIQAMYIFHWSRHNEAFIVTCNELFNSQQRYLFIQASWLQVNNFGTNYKVRLVFCLVLHLLISIFDNCQLVSQTDSLCSEYVTTLNVLVCLY